MQGQGLKFGWVWGGVRLTYDGFDFIYVLQARGVYHHPTAGISNCRWISSIYLGSSILPGIVGLGFMKLSGVVSAETVGCTRR